ncbi:MAG: trypsin-like peptidase domain-containing protein, partial [Candidatus Latescibacterota bacterium]
VTNNHVIENAGRIRVSSSGQREFDAEVVGADPGADLAVLRLKGNYQDLVPVVFGNSDSVRIGDVVLAIGSPFSLNRSVSMGIVSGKGRANFGVVEYENFIQTDAAINPGNSGGALVNIRGELIGINTAILSGSGGSQGVGFAIPSNMVLEVVDQILRNGRVIRGSLGVDVQAIDQNMLEAFTLSGESGVIVTDVIKGSPGEKTGLKPEDVILQVGEEQVETPNKFRTVVSFLKPGQQVRLTILRKGKEITVNARIGEFVLPKNKPEKFENWKPKPGGLSVVDLTPQNRKHLKIPESVQGQVVVVEVESGSAAEMAGFSPGDVIIEINRTPVKSFLSFRDRLQKTKGDILFRVRRAEGTFYRYYKTY